MFIFLIQKSEIQSMFGVNELEEMFRKGSSFNFSSFQINAFYVYAYTYISA